MKIAICDDEEIFAQKLYRYLWEETDCSVKCFDSPEKLLQMYSEGSQYDVLFLDIIMEPISGIELARKIRSYDEKALIIFMTVALEYAPAGYEVNAFRYILKPFVKEDIVRVMEAVRKKLASPHALIIDTQECELIIYTGDLYYAEADNKDSILYYMGDKITVRKSLGELEEKLPAESFFRVHRKYLVNLACVREFDDRKLTLDCGVTLPISRRRSADFCSAIGRYIEGDYEK